MGTPAPVPEDGIVDWFEDERGFGIVIAKSDGSSHLFFADKASQWNGVCMMPIPAQGAPQGAEIVFFRSAEKTRSDQSKAGRWAFKQIQISVQFRKEQQ